jgi:hypothetical protein
VGLVPVTTIGVRSEPLCFELDVAAEGGPVFLTPSAPHCTFTPGQVVVPAGASSSGCFVVTPGAAAPPGPLTLQVILPPDPGFARTGLVQQFPSPSGHMRYVFLLLDMGWGQLHSNGLP